MVKSFWREWVGRLFLGCVNLILAVAGTACLLRGVATLWQGGDLTAAATGLTAGLVLLLACTVDRFEVLKGLGVEARTRKLDEAITHANATLAQLREIAELSSESIVQQVAGAGRWDVAPTTKAAYETVLKVRKTLKGLGSKEEVIRETVAPWARITAGDLLRSLLPQLVNPLSSAVEEVSAKIRRLPQPINTGDRDYEVLTSERAKLGEFLSAFSLESFINAPVDTYAHKLQSLVSTMPIPLDQVERERLQGMIDPWLPRLNYLIKHSDLSDKEAWFALHSQHAT